ncbi:caspase-9-like protein, partial [Dinothrombium tinctorium]
MTAEPRGYCLIINNEDFRECGFQNRNGTNVDAIRLREVFKQLKFSTILCDNLRSYQILSEKDEGVQEEMSKNEKKYAQELQFKDMMVAYSTTDGYVSYLNEKYGSWFVDALCTVLCKHAADSDLKEIMRL